MPHRTSSTINDYERKINYDWPKCQFAIDNSLTFTAVLADKEKLKMNYRVNEMCCLIGYHLYNLKNVKNTHGEMLLLVITLLK